MELYGDLHLTLPGGERVQARAARGARAIVDRPSVKPSHAPDWSSVEWSGVRYFLTPKQRIIVALLWAAWQDGSTFVSGAYLLDRAETEQSRLSALFRDSPAWGKLIVAGVTSGGPADTYCLAPQEAE